MYTGEGQSTTKPVTVEPRDTARDFAVHPPKKTLGVRILEPLEDQIHVEEEPTILMYRVSVKRFTEWEAAILGKYGWKEMTGNEPWA